MKKQEPVSPLQTLKNGNSVTIPDFYHPSELLGVLTLLPYDSEELKPGDIVLVELDKTVRLEVTEQEIDEKSSKVLNDLPDGSCLVQIGLLNLDGAFYISFEDYKPYHKYSLCPFTKDMIYGKAFDRDSIFSDKELLHNENAARITPVDPSKLEVQYYLLNATKEPRTRVIWVFSASKALYPSPIEFWLDCGDYIRYAVDLDPFGPWGFTGDSECVPLPKANIEVLFAQWLDGVIEKPAQIIPLAEVKRAMFMIYYYYSRAILVETEDKWLVPVWYHQAEYVSGAWAHWAR